MAYWEWKPSYELGIITIDNQHKKLVYYINELCSAIATKERARVASILNGIVEHTTLHFALEERLMSEAGYEMLESHKKAHEAFAAAINKYKTSFDEGRDVAGQLMAEIQIWLTYHIANDDSGYKECVQEMLSNRAEQAAKERRWFKTLFR